MRARAGLRTDRTIIGITRRISNLEFRNGARELIDIRDESKVRRVEAPRACAGPLRKSPIETNVLSSRERTPFIRHFDVSAALHARFIDPRTIPSRGDGQLQLPSVCPVQSLVVNDACYTHVMALNSLPGTVYSRKPRFTEV